jgi:hypothetical protein
MNIQEMKSHKDDKRTTEIRMIGRIGSIQLQNIRRVEDNRLLIREYDNQHITHNNHTRGKHGSSCHSLVMHKLRKGHIR